MSTAADLRLDGPPYEAPRPEGSRFDSGSAARLRVGVTPVVRRRTPLSLVAPRRADVRQLPFVAVLVSLLVAGLLGLLVLNTVLAQGSFALFSLRADNRVLADREQTLLREVEALRSPDALAARAAAMGMVQAAQPAFLRLPDGVVLGTDTPAPAPLPAPVKAPVKAPAGADSSPAR